MSDSKLKLVPNKELHITPDGAAIEHYGRVHTIKVGVIDKLDIDPTDSYAHYIDTMYPEESQGKWVQFVYIDSPTMPKTKLIDVQYLPKEVYLRHTTVLH